MPDDKILEVAPDVMWTGVLDPGLITFDIVMETKFGSTYNSYFINATKKTVVETVKREFWETFRSKLERLTRLEDIEYIIMNHTEPDHSGSVGELLKLAPKAKIVGSGNAIRYLSDQLGFEPPSIQVKDGYELDLGNKKIRFIGAPNLHWPDTLYSFLEGENILFTCDSFGAHYSHPEMFDDRVGDFDGAFRYYFEVILKPYSRFMKQAIRKIECLPVRVICPGHGPILRSNWKKYVELSEKWAEEALAEQKKNHVFIGYVSAYHNTEKIARLVAEGIREEGGVSVELMDIEKTGIHVIEMKIRSASGIILGSPIINQNILLQIYQVFAVINPVRDRGKLAGAFGSYGWSGEGVKIINASFEQLKLKVFGEGLNIRFTPHNETEVKCREYGAAFAKQLKEENKN